MSCIFLFREKRVISLEFEFSCWGIGFFDNFSNTFVIKHEHPLMKTSLTMVVVSLCPNVSQLTMLNLHNLTLLLVSLKVKHFRDLPF
jgi:hypothetical protein